MNEIQVLKRANPACRRLGVRGAKNWLHAMIGVFGRRVKW